MAANSVIYSYNCYNLSLIFKVKLCLTYAFSVVTGIHNLEHFELRKLLEEDGYGFQLK